MPNLTPDLLLIEKCRLAHCNLGIISAAHSPLQHKNDPIKSPPRLGVFSVSSSLANLPIAFLQSVFLLLLISLPFFTNCLGKFPYCLHHRPQLVTTCNSNCIFGELLKITQKILFVSTLVVAALYN